MALTLLGCGIAFKNVGYGDVKHRVVLRLLPPFVVAVNVREGCHFTAFQDHQPVIELTFATGGQPDVFGEKEGTDDCGLLRLHQCYIGIDLILIIEQVLAEQALGESPFRRKQVRSLEVGVHPHYRRKMVILDAMAGLRVVGDDFPAAAATQTGIESNRITERPIFYFLLNIVAGNGIPGTQGGTMFSADPDFYCKRHRGYMFAGLLLSASVSGITPVVGTMPHQFFQ